MREIKFRAWYIPEKRMIEWNELFSQIREHYYDIFVDNIYRITMQYTGLKDKNGKEIYEGDIVTRRATGLPCEVYWSEYTFDYRLACRGDRQYDKTYPLMFASEVIGNIYENPGLLEKELK